MLKKNIANSYRRGNRLLTELGNVTQIFLLLFFRLNWGWQFFVTGKGKLLNHHDVAVFFTSLHIPFPDLTAWLIAIIECVGGLFLMAGLAARPTGLILTGTMIGAYMSVVADRQKVFNFFNDQTPFLQADPFFFLLTALLVFSSGAGPISLDALIETISRGRKNKAPSLD